MLRKGLMPDADHRPRPPARPACKGIIVERERLDAILAEIALSQSPLADPSTRLRSDRLIEHNREVTGSLTVAGGTMTLSVRITNVKTGVVRTVTRSSTPDRFFELEQSVVQETARLICGDKPPAAYSGPISGETSVADNTGSQKISWSGNVRLRFTGDVLGAIGDEPPGEYAYYEPESGSVHVIIDGAAATARTTARRPRRSRPSGARAGTCSRASTTRPTSSSTGSPTTPAHRAADDLRPRPLRRRHHVQPFPVFGGSSSGRWAGALGEHDA